MALDQRFIRAANTGDLSEAEAAIKSGADPNARGQQDSTALHWAAQRGDLPLVRYLLSCSADFNAIDALGWTPLTLAHANGFAAIAELLISEGAITQGTLQGRNYNIRLEDIQKDIARFSKVLDDNMSGGDVLSADEEAHFKVIVAAMWVLGGARLSPAKTRDIDGVNYIFDTYVMPDGRLVEAGYPNPTRR